MTKDKIIKISLGALAVLLIVFFYFSSNVENQYDWRTSFEPTSKSPYGSFLLYELIKGDRSDEEFQVIDKPLSVYLSDSSITNSSYIFYGSSWFYNESDIDMIQDYVRRGNKALIVSQNSPFEIVYSSDYYTGYFNTFGDSVANLKVSAYQKDALVSNTLKYVENWEPEWYIWSYLDSISGNQSFTALGEYELAKVNFAQVDMGKGSLYFHTTPLAFTNFYLREEKGLEYAQEVFSRIDNEVIFWDKYSQAPYGSGDSVSESPLKFILSQPGLRWAWYLTLVLVLIYMLFYTKRRQKVIPVMSKVSNTSIEFVETIGSLYFKQDGNLKIVKHKKKLLLAYIRQHYNIHTNKIDEEFVEKVSLKSGVDEEKITAILKDADRLEFKVEVTDEELIEFHKLTDFFYKNCR